MWADVEIDPGKCASRCAHDGPTFGELSFRKNGRHFVALNAALGVSDTFPIHRLECHVASGAGVRLVVIENDRVDQALRAPVRTVEDAPRRYAAKQ